MAGEGIDEVLQLEEETGEVRGHSSEEKGARGPSSPWRGKWRGWWRWLEMRQSPGVFRRRRRAVRAGNARVALEKEEKGVKKGW
jgi:hypothetical protein